MQTGSPTHHDQLSSYRLAHHEFSQCSLFFVHIASRVLCNEWEGAFLEAVKHGTSKAGLCLRRTRLLQKLGNPAQSLCMCDCAYVCMYVCMYVWLTFPRKSLSPLCLWLLYSLLPSAHRKQTDLLAAQTHRQNEWCSKHNTHSETPSWLPSPLTRPPLTKPSPHTAAQPALGLYVHTYYNIIHL